MKYQLIVDTSTEVWEPKLHTNISVPNVGIGFEPDLYAIEIQIN